MLCVGSLRFRCGWSRNICPKNVGLAVRPREWEKIWITDSMPWFPLSRGGHQICWWQHSTNLLKIIKCHSYQTGIQIKFRTTPFQYRDPISAHGPDAKVLGLEKKTLEATITSQFAFFLVFPPDLDHFLFHVAFAPLVFIDFWRHIIKASEKHLCNVFVVACGVRLHSSRTTKICRVSDEGTVPRGRGKQLAEKNTPRKAYSKTTTFLGFQTWQFFSY